MSTETKGRQYEPIILNICTPGSSSKGSATAFYGAGRCSWHKRASMARHYSTCARRGMSCLCARTVRFIQEPTSRGWKAASSVSYELELKHFMHRPIKDVWSRVEKSEALKCFWQRTQQTERSCNSDHSWELLVQEYGCQHLRTCWAWTWRGMGLQSITPGSEMQGWVKFADCKTSQFQVQSTFVVRGGVGVAGDRCSFLALRMT